MEDAKNHAIASERLTFLTGDVFDQHKETKKEVSTATSTLFWAILFKALPTPTRAVFYPPPHAPCTVVYLVQLVPMMIGC